MKMSESSRAEDKKPQVNNNLDYQLERLHIYGDQHPNSGLKNKVIGYQFKEQIQVPDPVRKTFHKEPLKPFMVNALSKCFEDRRMILSPFDDVLHKQLVDYTIERITPTGTPVFTSKNEHFVDALGLAYLAMVLKFPDTAQFIKEIEHSSGTIAEVSNSTFNRGERALRQIETVRNPWGNKIPKQIGKQPGEREGDYQKWVKAPLRVEKRSNSNGAFSRSIGRGNFGGRSLW